MVGDVLLDNAGDFQIQQLRLALDDGDAGLKIRRLDVRDQAPLEAGAQPFLQRFDLLGRSVGGQDDLLVVLVERIEGVEELLLGALLAADELDIVD